MLKETPKRRQGELPEEHQRRVLAYLEEHVGEGGEAFEIYAAMMRLIGAPVPPEEEERALTRFASGLPPEPRPTPRASALMRRLGVSSQRVRDRYLEIWMQEGAERLVVYRVGSEELCVRRRLGSTRADMWLGGDESGPQVSVHHRHRNR